MEATQLPLLIERELPLAARGDRDAFATLVDATRNIVASIAISIVRDAELGHDVAQDVFLSAWRDLGQLRDARSFLPWLRQLTRHRAYHVVRGERRRKRRITSAASDELLIEAIDPRPGVEADLAAADDRRLLRAVLDELPDETREVVTLFYWEGESTTKVAELLGLSDAAVRKRISRARKLLRASLLQHFAEAAQRATPGAALTAAVMTALSVGAPATAVAATGAATASLGGTSASTLAKLSTVAWSILLPAAGGIAGVLFGTRQMKRQARSARELIGLRRFELTSVVLVLVTAIAFPAAWILTGSRWAPVITFALFLAGLASLHTVWLPRIQRERHALEAIEDPIRAARERARERRAAILGWTLGVLSGTAGLVLGIWL
jgi:RNA polymerase sigma factor (sigma-70 family)